MIIEMQNKINFIFDSKYVCKMAIKQPILTIKYDFKSWEFGELADVNKFWIAWQFYWIILAYKWYIYDATLSMM